MANALFKANVAQESARNRVANELMPRQQRLNQQYSQQTPYATFNQPSDDALGLFGLQNYNPTSPLTANDYASISYVRPQNQTSEFGFEQPQEGYYTIGGNRIHKEGNSYYINEDIGVGRNALMSLLKGEPKKRTMLNDYGNRVMNALQYEGYTKPGYGNPEFSDLKEHPNYDKIRKAWYSGQPLSNSFTKVMFDLGLESPPSENFYKYFPKESNEMSKLDKQYGGIDGYIPTDYYAYKESIVNPIQTYGNSVERARNIGSQWANQPSLQGRVNWDQVAPWATQEASNRAKAYIAEEAKEEQRRESASAFGGLGGLIGLGLTLAGAPHGVTTLWGTKDFVK